MSDTPRTDSELKNGYHFCDAPDANIYINANFARQLERGIKELNDRLIKQQQDFQFQLIRIEDTWREKLKEQRAQILDLALCEGTRLILRPNQLYRFTAMPDCALCQEAAAYSYPK